MTAANSAIASVNAAIANINTNMSAANSGLATHNTTFGTINTNIGTAYSQANTSANSVWIYANGTSVLSNSNINFNNTATVQVLATANGTTQSNIAFTVNTTGADFASGANSSAQTTFTTTNTTFGTVNTNISTAYGQANAAYTKANNAAVYANGIIVIGNTANINFNNTATVQVASSANGTLQSNIAFTVITTGADFASGANSSAQTTFGTINTNIGTAYSQANAAYTKANNAAVYANGTIVISNTANINFNNTATVQVASSANGTLQSNIAFTVITTGADFASGANSSAQTTFTTINSQVSGVYTLANTALVRSGGTMTGNINMTPGATGYIIQPQMLSYREYQNNLGIVSSGTLAIDCATSNYFQVTLGANITSVTFSNIPGSTQVYSFNLIVVQNATGTWTITWPASVKWSGGQIPPATTAANAVDVWSFMTYNGGTSWIGSLAVKNAS